MITNSPSTNSILSMNLSRLQLPDFFRSASEKRSPAELRLKAALADLFKLEAA
jgi:hypothetical protein